MLGVKKTEKWPREKKNSFEKRASISVGKERRAQGEPDGEGKEIKSSCRGDTK